ncbi:MAG: hypothetical protein COA58_14935 [Bacteroidetes bacterium]|nr:MAG: hypothetical protein COA58_14935 [Bacteroidota bacterium]
MEISQFRMFMHLSQFGSMIVPLGGIVLPIVMWSTYKDQDAEIDEHGKNIINWIISSTIYLFASIILCFVLIGIPLLFGIIICSIVFTIQGAIKANNGEVYKYPLSIKFIK